MFGHVFQKHTLPAAYRQLDWIQTDGAAYLNIGFTGPNDNQDAAVALQLNAILPDAASCRPGTLFGFDGGVGLKLTANSVPLFVPDSEPVVATNTKVSGDNETFSLYVARDKYGKVASARFVWGSIDETRTWAQLLSSRLFDDTTAECVADLSLNYTACTITGVVFSTYEAFPEIYSNYSVAFPAQTATGSIEWQGHKMIAWSGNLDPVSTDNTTICSAMLNGIAHPLAYLWFNWLPILYIGSAAHVRLDSSKYTFYEDGLPDQITYTPGDTYIFANRKSSGAADDFCPDLKIRSAQVLTVTRLQSGVDFTTSVARNLVAAMRLSDNAPGLYDQTLDLFFANAAPTGSFLYQEITT